MIKPENKSNFSKSEEKDKKESSAFKIIQVSLPQHSILNQSNIEYIDNFFQFVSPEKLKERLFRIFLLYLVHEFNSLPGDFDEIASDYYLLFQMLEKLGDEKC